MIWLCRFLMSRRLPQGEEDGIVGHSRVIISETLPVLVLPHCGGLLGSNLDVPFVRESLVICRDFALIKPVPPLQLANIKYTIILFVCPPKILLKHCFYFVLGRTGNNAYAKFWVDKQRVLRYF